MMGVDNIGATAGGLKLILTHWMRKKRFLPDLMYGYHSTTHNFRCNLQNRKKTELKSSRFRGGFNVCYFKMLHRRTTFGFGMPTIHFFDKIKTFTLGKNGFLVTVK
jgi:hypothetical protein